MTKVAAISFGARTAVGLRADTSAAAVRAGISRLQLHPRYVDLAGEGMRLAYDGRLDPGLPLAERMIGLATSALTEACEVLLPLGRPTLSLFVALPEPRPGYDAAIGQRVQSALVRHAQAFATVEKVVPFPHGHAAGFMALQAAAAELAARRAELAIVGGVDSWLDPATLEWLDLTRQLDSDRNRGGFTPGEAACFTVVGPPDIGRRSQLHAQASVLGIGVAREPQPITSLEPCLGLGLCAAVEQATQGLRLPEQKISTTYCDINGVRYRSEEFMYLPLRQWGPFVDSNQYTAPADCWGDVGAASGPLLLCLSAMSAARGYAKGRYALAWASSLGGTRGAAAIELPEVRS